MQETIVIMEKTINGKTLRLVQGDITERKVDVIVNAANSYLQHDGGVALAISRKGGPTIQEESNKIGYVPAGYAALTNAGNLACRAVIHTVGPKMGEGKETEKLKSAIKNSLKIATEKNFSSISIPAISSGIFGFPKDRCAKVILSQTKKFMEKNPNSSIKIFEVCIFDHDTFTHFKKEFTFL